MSLTNKEAANQSPQRGPRQDSQIYSVTRDTARDEGQWDMGWSGLDTKQLSNKHKVTFNSTTKQNTSYDMYPCVVCLKICFPLSNIHLSSLPFCVTFSMLWSLELVLFVVTFDKKKFWSVTILLIKQDSNEPSSSLISMV